MLPEGLRAEGRVPTDAVVEGFGVFKQASPGQFMRPVHGWHLFWVQDV